MAITQTEIDLRGKGLLLHLFDRPATTDEPTGQDWSVITTIDLMR